MSVTVDHSCYHCGTSCSSDDLHIGDKFFCCTGCQTVYSILAKSDLCTYYDLNRTPAQIPVTEVQKEKFAFLDRSDIQQKLILFRDEKQSHARFYLPQIHCSSCLWLLENINRIQPAILQSRIDFVQKQLFVVWDNSISLRELVETLTAIGYEPHLSQQEIGQVPGTSPTRTELYKIGIAGFGFSNIMMLSFPEYLSFQANIDPVLKYAFLYFSFILSLPVFFYSASGFFQSAWQGLRNRFLHIDVPVALAILITFLRSVYEIFTHTGSGYLDSMSGIVFFMLIGRWLQDRTHTRLAFDRDYRSFFPVSVPVMRDGKLVPVLVEEVKPQEVVKIYEGELVPVDGLLSRGNAAIDYSFVSGESIPVTVQPGEWIYAGGRQTAGAIELVVTREATRSYLVNLWNNPVFQKTKSAKPSFIHAVSAYFTYIVFALGAIAAAYWWQADESARMWNAFTTILIVACPCALLLSSSFTYGHILRLLAKQKIYFRNPEMLEQLANVNHVVLDKTGTISQRQNARVSYEGENLSNEQKVLIKSVLLHSAHPAARAVVQFLESVKPIPVEHSKETSGQGIEAWINEHYLKIGSPAFLGTEQKNSEASVVLVAIDNHYVGQFFIRAGWRKGIQHMLQTISQNMPVTILSGDHDYDRPALQQMLTADADLYFRQQPEDKLEYIRSLQTQPDKCVLMVGDGLNDAGALRQSDVGIAVSENSNSFTPASDAIMDAAKLHQLDAVIDFARSGKKIILFTFAVSLLYNIVGLYFALQGILSPVVAAILMPASSISILLITWLTSELAARRLLKIHDEGHIAG